jgi:hypothetical protein
VAHGKAALAAPKDREVASVELLAELLEVGCPAGGDRGVEKRFPGESRDGSIDPKGAITEGAEVELGQEEPVILKGVDPVIAP